MITPAVIPFDPTATAPAAPSPTQTRTPRPTATETETPTPTRTDTPTVTPTPTETPLPEDRLQQALAWQKEGDLEQAKRDYAAMAAAPPGETSAEVRLQAAYRLGECYHLDGHWVEAVAALERFLEEHPESPFRQAALFRLADSLLQLGEFEKAEARFDEYLADDETLADLVYERLADVYAAGGQDEKALAWYSQTLDTSAGAARELLVREKMARAHQRLGDVEEAVANYQTILRRAQYAPYRAQIAYTLGELLAGEEREAEALRAYQSAVDADVRGRYAYLAMVRLVEAEAPLDEFQRGVTDYYNQVHSLAAAAFGRVLDDRDHPQRDEARLYLGRTHRALGTLDIAAEWYRLATQSSPEAPWIADAWLEMADVLNRAGKPEEAREVLEEFAETYAQHPRRPAALWQRVQVLANAKGCQAALPEYRALADAVPESSVAIEGLLTAGLCLYEDVKAGDSLGAFQKALRLSQQQASPANAQKAAFWVGKALAAVGRTAEARQAWQTLAQEAPETYYGLRAGELARPTAPNTDELARPSLGSPLPQSDTWPTPTVEPAVLEWIAQWADAPARTPAQVETAFRDDDRFRRAQALLEAGLGSQADSETETLRRDLESDPAALYALAVWLHREGLHRPGVLAARAVVNLSPAQTLAAAPAPLARLVYPLDYQTLLLKEARSHGLDPRVLAAVIRQESLFQVQAVSSAQARGLMQVIGDTGRWIALQIGWRNFQESQLHLPYVNVRFGAYYLQVQLDSFDGALSRALVAYNAGPGRAAQWSKDRPDPDLFVERIALSEPRTYVERVYEGYHQYRRLYDAALLPQE
ncbi:MAG: tetratricopeptide repeat protein [Chloroflexi bacterium]|nr:tetratricopeptide repeat protein [Chloroflexota bacterium]